MRFAMDDLHAQNADLLWCNARIKAVPFYERLGLTVVGDAFRVPASGRTT